MKRIITIATVMVVFCSGIAAFASSEIQNGDRVYIRSRANHYVNADNGMGNVKMIGHKSTVPASDEQWWIEKADGEGAIQNGDRVYIRSRANHYVNADNGMGNVKMIGHKSTVPASDEQWWIEKADGEGAIQNGDRVYIRSRANHYVNADNGMGNVKMIGHKSTVPASDEQWWIEKAD